VHDFTGDFHRPGMLRIEGRQPQAAIRLLDRIELVPLFQIQPGQQFLRQDYTNRIADLADLLNSVIQNV
jgi:hypothetical protein